MEKKKIALGCLNLVIILICLSVIISTCAGSEEKTFDVTLDEYEGALKQVIEDTKGNSFIEIQDKKLLEDNRYSIVLADGIFNFIDVNENNKVQKIDMAATSDAFLVYNKEIRIAFQALLKSIDNTLSVTQQLMIFEELGITGNSDMLNHTGVYSINGITYTYQGNVEKDIIVLKATPQ